MSSSPSGPSALAHRAARALTTYKQLAASGAQPTAEQRDALAGWTGWGPLAPLFKRKPEGAWADLAAQMPSLTDEERLQGVAATDTAFYTTPAVASAMWQALEDLGFDGGRVLEPGCGSGAFFAAAPPGLPVELFGVEMDPASAGIARLLHPHATVLNRPLERAPLRPGSFDAAIGNIPFSGQGPYDPTYPAREAGGQPTLHGYFLWKTVQAVRPGGLIALITSRFHLDAAKDAFRTHLDGEVEFLGAVRLPSRTFRQMGTSVVADILLLRRTVDGDAANPWHDTGEVHGTCVNTYFLSRPEQVVGQMRERDGHRHGHTLDVVLEREADLEGELRGALARVSGQAREHGRLYLTDIPTAQEIPAEPSDEKEGSYQLVAGDLVQIRGGFPQPVRATPELLRLVTLRDAAVALFDADADPACTDETVAVLREHARGLYEAYIGRFGPLNRCVLAAGRPDPETGLPTVTRQRPTLDGFRADPHYPAVLALEDYDDDTEEGAPAPILLRRVNRPAVRKRRTDDPREAVALCLDQCGRLEPQVLAGLLDCALAQVPERLGGLAYVDPESGQWVTAEEYTSGNVRAKLTEAVAAAAGDARFERNVAALQQVQPRDLEPVEIRARLGSPWIPELDIRRFIAQLFNVELRDVEVRHEPLTGSWEVKAPTARRRAAATTQWGTDRINALDIIQHALNNSSPTIYDTLKEAGEDGKGREVKRRNAAATQLADERLKALQESFSSWIWQDPQRADRLARRYNDLYNCVRLRRYDGSWLTFPGLDAAFNPYVHQRDMVARVLLNPGVELCGHDVGAGKTAIQYMTALKLKELGLIRKACLVVPNHLLEQIAADGRRLFPGARVLMVTRDDLTPERRKLFAGKVAAADWDVVVMTHEQFTSIPVSPGAEAAYLADVIQQCQEAIDAADDDDTLPAKRLAGQIRKLRTRHARLVQRRYRDDGLTWEQLGLDYLMVDEAHYFKNLFAPTRAEGLAVPSSKRAEDLHLKLTVMRKRKPGGHVAALFTATPVSNSLVEIYTLLRYLAPGLLAQMGMAALDAFAGMFIAYETRLEIAPDGSGFRMHRRPARFHNVPELLLMLNAHADILTREDLKLGGPRRLVRRNVIVQPTPELPPASGNLVTRADAIRAGRPLKRMGRLKPGSDRRVPKDDNMLWVLGDGRNLSLDVRLSGLTPTGPTLTDALVANVAEVYHRTKDNLYPDPTGAELYAARPGGFQLVFCDLGTPGKDEVRDAEGNVLLGPDKVYGLIRDGLVKAGVPREKIAFAHDAQSPADTKAQDAACCDGRLAVQITSTSKGGTGKNLQPRMVAIHHADAPWRPDELKQRDGRGNRPGNHNETLEIYYYAVERSFAPYVWQGLERKSVFVNQILSSRSGAVEREVADVLSEETLSYGQMKAASTGQELVMQLEEVKAQVLRLSNMATAHTLNDNRLRARAADLKRDLERQEANAAALRLVARQAEGRARQWTHWADKSADEGEAARILAHNAAAAVRDRAERKAGNWRGVAVYFVPLKNTEGASFGFQLVDQSLRDRTQVYPGVDRHLQDGQEWRLTRAIDKVIDTAEVAAQEAAAAAEGLREELADVNSQRGGPFPQAQELAEALRRQQELTERIERELAPAAKTASA